MEIARFDAMDALHGVLIDAGSREKRNSPEAVQARATQVKSSASLPFRDTRVHRNLHVHT